MAERIRAEGRPWFLVLEFFQDELAGFRDLPDLGEFRVSIREMESYRLVTDMANEPMEFHDLCADVLTKAQAMVREAGPEDSDFEYLYLWNCDEQEIAAYSLFLPKDIKLSIPTWPDIKSRDLRTLFFAMYYPIDELLARLRSRAEAIQVVKQDRMVNLCVADADLDSDGEE